MIDRKSQILCGLILFLLFNCKKEGSQESFSLNLAGKKGGVPVRIQWLYKGLPGKMEIYELASQRPVRLWDTSTAARMEEAPVSSSIPDSKLVLSAGETRRFALVYKNETKEKLYFFAAPHAVDPPEFGFGFKFKCLCVNHLFQVEPGSVWYRVVEIRTMPNWASEEFDITHTLVRVDPSQAKEWESQSAHSHSDE
ncbi:hypothetical protein EHQ53_01845 [Leptospira langatensis]|uniref:Lipoprotein n=1 Tax=Leptospira langatensis TaxID=2484983 RepID=A0A5F1ZZB9_9LEPT|nr:hypothetical protein [Leptospira langatensis]TGJ98489.1 hypothetical protein EHO57_17985 [Leptospira langatensis]TGL43403.1 hypothetical protein EHQ53_01845 [Leptospira langatensis]